MSITLPTDLTKAKAGDLVDAIYELVLSLDPAMPDYEELFKLVDELRARSIKQHAKRTNKTDH